MSILKLSCEICALKFGSENEVIEHYCSLPHHIKQIRQQPNSKRECALCLASYDTLAEFSRHLDSELHSQALDRFRRSKALVNNHRTNFSSSNCDDRSRSSYQQAVESSSGTPFQPRISTLPMSTRNHPQPLFPKHDRRVVLEPYRPRQHFVVPVLAPGTGCSVNNAQPPWFPPGLPQTLRFTTPVDFSEDSFADLMSSFQAPPAPTPNLYNYSSASSSPRPTPSHNIHSEWRPGPRRVLIQSSISSIEPGVPIDVRKLAQSERYAPTTSFTKSKLREESHRLRLERWKKKRSTEAMAEKNKIVDSKKTSETTTTADKNSSKLKKKKKKLKGEKRLKSGKSKRRKRSEEESSAVNASAECTASTSSGTPRYKGQEADSTTSSDGRSLTKRKSASATPITAAAYVKRQRLLAKAQQRTSDRLLADRLSRYRLVVGAATEGQTTATTSNAKAAAAANSDAPSSTTPLSNTLTTRAINAKIRERARHLFRSCVLSTLASTTTASPPSSSSNPESQSKQKDQLRMPKAETSDCGAASIGSEHGDSSTAESLSIVGSPPMITDVRSLASLSPDKNASIPALQELWTLCKREEQIRAERSQLGKEMDRLKQELHRVWYRQKELEMQEQECLTKKKRLLSELHENEKEDEEQL